MTITQTINVPASRRITLPSEVPVGPTIITFTPAAAPAKRKLTGEEEKEFFKKNAKRINKEMMDVLKDQEDFFVEPSQEELLELQNLSPSAIVSFSKEDLIK